MRREEEGWGGVGEEEDEEREEGWGGVGEEDEEERGGRGRGKRGGG